MIEKRWYSLAEAKDHSDLSSGMIHYLSRINVLKPAGTVTGKRGRPKRYSFGDIVMLRAIARLLEQGIEVKRLRVELKQLAEHCQRMTPDHRYAFRYLVTDGRDVYFKGSDEILEKATDGQLAFAFLIDIHRLEAEVVEFRGTPPSERRRRTRGLPPKPRLPKTAARPPG